MTVKVRKLIPKHKRIVDQPDFIHEDFDMNIANINYSREYIDQEENGKDNFFTMVYFLGSPKGMVIAMRRSEFLKACAEAANPKNGSN